MIVVPQFVFSAQSLTGTITGYVTAHRMDIERFLSDFNITDITGPSSQNMLLQWEDIMRTGMDYLGKLLLSLLNMSYSLWGVSVNLFMSVIISIYCCSGGSGSWRRARRCARVSEGRSTCACWPMAQRTHQIFTGFISGKLIETVGWARPAIWAC